jgi:antitoxin ParD1/3/4
MTTVAITLNDEHEQFIREAVDTGTFATKSEVVAIALEMLKVREELRRARRAELKREIDKGIADLDSGNVVPFDLEQFLADMRAKHPAQG